MFTKQSLALAIALLAPMGASAEVGVPESTFRLFYDNGTTPAGSGKPLLYDNLTYKSGDLSMTFQAFDGAGKKISVSQQSGGIGALDQGDFDDYPGLGYPTVASAGEYLTVTFNKAVRINSLTMSDWAWNLQANIGDNAALLWDGGAPRFMTNNISGYLAGSRQDVVWFDMPSDAISDTFTLRSIPRGERLGFFLAGINVTAVTPVPEPATYALMGLGLAGILLMKRRRLG